MIDGLISIERSCGTDIPYAIVLNTDSRLIESTVYLDFSCLRPDILQDVVVMDIIEYNKNVHCRIELQTRYMYKDFKCIKYNKCSKIVIGGREYTNIRDYF